MRNFTKGNNRCIAVIGGFDHEGESFHTLRLFDCQSTADLYKAKLQQEYDYVLMDIRNVCQYSAMMGGTVDDPELQPV